ncbi:LLM class flavin-dependent oxidoreductase [Pseudolabrys taiwanensis]|uniref:LLM class flavin-dependent oxidoreductase n=1 Tax=Pseudolabrys taiwanensis TaxID=331696 RepID=A0A345ZSM7_9HYPH|nr:LLM class flavin-dependent oxidoreductase [Pseudolabrys taiwanensis]AXK79924.1 LLM class flavin-dependent oxidoreductase [Pseudolabrys taiwanensis]
MTNPMRGPNKFKLGLFSMNCDGGLALTKVPERWPATWPDIVAAAQMADKAGLEFILPIARWKGFGGEMNSREWAFETFSFASGLSGVTQNIALFATVHVPMVHPVFAAKALTTLDHASNGRAGFNIVCGWNPEEFGMFGLPMIENRYDQGLEWFEIIQKIYTAPEPFDYDGQFYKLKAVSGKPAPIQTPRPITLNAAFSPPGREFAAKAADYLFTTFVEIEKGREHIDDMKKRAAVTGRDVGVFTTCSVVCRPSQAEAEDYFEHYAVTMADTESVDHYMGQKEKFSGSHEPEAYRLHRKRFAGGAGGYPLVGTPEHIASEMVKMSKVGFAGTALSFVNYKNELPYFISHVLPLLREAGLRQA